MPEGAENLDIQKHNTGSKIHRKLLVAIMLAAFAVRLVWVLAIPTQPISDFKDIDRLAVDLISGRGYTATNGQPTAYRPPGYMFYLASVYSIFGHQQLIGRLSNVLLGVLTCWLTYYLTVELFDRRTALITALLIAFFPSLIAWANMLATENLFIPVLLGIFISFLRAVKTGLIRWGWLILCGILSGIGALIRPAALMLPAILVFTMTLKSSIKLKPIRQVLILWKPIAIALALYLLIIATVLPWTVRNTRVFNRFVFLTTEGGINLLAGHNERALSAEYSVEGPVFDKLNAQKLDEISYDKQAYQLAFQFIRQNPGFELRLLFHKFINFYKDDVSGFTYTALSALSPLPSWFVLASKGVAEVYYLLVLGLAVASLFVKKYPDERWYLIMMIFILAWTAFHLVYIGKDRYRLPLTPALAQLAAVTILAIWDRVKLQYVSIAGRY